jgi:hypothetical protein
MIYSIIEGAGCIASPFFPAASSFSEKHDRGFICTDPPLLLFVHRISARFIFKQFLTT